MLVMIVFCAGVCLRKKLHKKQSNTAAIDSPEYFNVGPHLTSIQIKENVAYETSMQSMDTKPNIAYSTGMQGHSLHAQEHNTV